MPLRCNLKTLFSAINYKHIAPNGAKSLYLLEIKFASIRVYSRAKVKNYESNQSK